MTIFSDTQLPAPSLQLLREGTASHELVFSRQLSASVLAPGGFDPAFTGAEIAFGQPDPQSVMDSPTIRWVHLSSAGYTRYDTPEFRAAAQTRGFVCTNSSSVYAEACAEHLFSFMLAQARALPEALRSRTGNGTEEWLRLRAAGRLLRGQRVVILGYGAIAAHLAAMLAPFQMEVSALRRQPRGDEAVRIITHDHLAAELAWADHVANILPENAETRGFVSAARIAQMKPGAAFYNIGRGSTVDQEALADALRSGRLAAAWLDVSTPEPLPEGHPLLSLSNCYLTPHTAGGQSGESETLVRHFLANLRRFASGEALVDRVA